MSSHTQETAEMKMVLFHPIFSIALLRGFCFNLKVLLSLSQDYIILEGSTVKVRSSRAYIEWKLVINQPNPHRTTNLMQ